MTKIFVSVPFLLCFILYLRANSKYKPQGAYIRRGDLTRGFLRYEFGGLIFGGAFFWNFTVYCFSKIQLVVYYQCCVLK